MKIVKVVAAVITHENKILCAQKGDHKYEYLSKKYEFPGGKVEENETSEQALIREIFEELNIDVQIVKHLITVNHSYPDFNIELQTYLCNSNSITKLTLAEHKSIEWLAATELMQLNWAAADIPIVNYLLDNKI